MTDIAGAFMQVGMSMEPIMNKQDKKAVCSTTTKKELASSYLVLLCVETSPKRVLGFSAGFR